MELKRRQLWTFGFAALLVAGLTLVQVGVPQDAQGDVLPPGAIARLGTTRFRHDSPVICQAVSPDGRWLATGGGRTIRVWETASGKQAQLLTILSGNRPATPSALGFSGDSRFLAALSSSQQGMVSVWDVTFGKPQYEFMLPYRDDAGSTSANELPFLALVAQNKSVLVKQYGERLVREFDLESGKETRTFSDRQSSLSAIAIAPNREVLAAGSETGQAILWSLATGQEIQRLSHRYPLVSLSFSPDSALLATMDQDLSPILWEVSSGKELQKLPARTRSVGLTFGPHAKTLIVARQPDQLSQWDLESQQESTLTLPRGWVSTAPLLYVPSHSLNELPRWILGTSTRRGVSTKIRTASFSDGLASPSFDGYENGNVFPFYLGALKQWATIGTAGDDMVRLWDAHGKNVRSFTLPIHDQQLRSYAVAADGNRFVLGCGDGRILLVDARAGKLLLEIPAFSRPCFDTEISTDGETIVATDLRTMKVYDVRTGKQQQRYEVSQNDALRLMISGDGSRAVAMVYGEDDQPALRLYEARTGKVLQESRYQLPGTTYYLSHDGRSILFLANRGSRSAQITMLESATGKVRATFDLPSPYQYVGIHARISLNGRWLMTTASGPEPEQFAAVGWRLGAKGDPVVFHGHRGSLVSVNYSSDSSQLLTLSNDSTMLVWDIARHEMTSHVTHDEVKRKQLWHQLGDQDAAKAFVAIHQLARDNQAEQWLGQVISKQAASVELSQVKALIERLDASKFEDRERTTQELIRLGGIALPAVKLALEQAQSAEARRRLQRILEQGRETTIGTGISLQMIRAVETIELIGNDSALAELKSIGLRQDALGHEARLAALRLEARLNSNRSH